MALSTKRSRISYWLCQAGGWGLYSVLGMAGASRQLGWSLSLVAAYTLFCFYSIALTDLLRREIRRRGWLQPLSFHACVRLFFAAAAIAAVQTFLVVAIDFGLRPVTGYFLHHANAVPTLFAGITGADCAWIVYYAAITARRRGREREVTLQLALREAELRALEAQINPHFLFNCLNSIRALVVENPPMAQDMITRFASILRYNLHRDLMHTVPLAAEVEVVADYLALEGIRFEDRLRVHFAIEPEAALAGIPPMMLQTLVENAIKHGIARLPGGGDLTIRATLQNDALLVEVENTGRLQEVRADAGQVGINNTRERLRILYGPRAKMLLENRGDHRVVASLLVPRTV